MTRPPVDRTVPPLLRVEGLSVHFPARGGLLGRGGVGVQAVREVSFDLWRGETLGLVGESGCGKSTLGRAILRLIEPNAGTVTFAGKDLSRLGRVQLRDLRRRMQIVFQDPFSSLNPRMSVRSMLMEVLSVLGSHQDDPEARAAWLLERVGLSSDDLDRYPHEFSGGQRQRLGIARALAADPWFIVLDEPVSSLDVSVQAQVVNLLDDLQRDPDLGLTYLFIAHDLSVVAHVSDRVAVMKAGEVVEIGDAEEVYRNPRETYTKTLLAAIPSLNRAGR